MPFGSLKLKPESGANQIKSADDAYSFVAHMRLSYQNKPHWQVARQALNHAGASDANEIQAWRAFRVAVRPIFDTAFEQRRLRFLNALLLAVARCGGKPWIGGHARL
jgi:hypothetical protein